MSESKKRLTLKFDPVTHSKIKKIADKKHKTMSNIIVHIIEENLKLFEKENGEIELNDKWLNHFNIF